MMIYRIANENGLAKRILVPGHTETVFGDVLPEIDDFENRWNKIVFSKLIIPFLVPENEEYSVLIDCDMKPLLDSYYFEPLFDFDEPIAMVPSLKDDFMKIFPFNSGIIIFNNKVYRAEYPRSRIIECIKNVIVNKKENIGVSDENVIQALNMPWKKLDEVIQCRYERWHDGQWFWHMQGSIQG
ncbi:hypothetical protein R83H12_00566 [Fibrobacteria bacterium R8-3-H12]